MPTRALEIVINGKDNASHALGRVGGALGGLGKAATIGLAAVATASIAAGAGLLKLAADAAPLEGIQNAFAGLAQSAGSSQEEMLAALRKGSAGMVSQRDLMLSFNQAAQLVSTQFATQLPEAMQYLGKVSAATGQDMGFLMESLVRGVGRMSPMILDNLAIQVDVTKANEDYAKTLGKSVDQLTKQEQQTALMNQVLVKLKENTAAMPDVAESAAAKMARLSVTIRDMKDRISLALLPVFVAFVDLAQRAVNRVLPLLENAIAGLSKTLQAFGNYVSAVLVDGDYLNDWLTHLPDAIQPAVRFFGEMLAAFPPLIEYIRWTWREGDSLNDWLTHLPANIQGPVEAFGDLIVVVKEFVTEHAEGLKAAFEAIAKVVASAALINGLSLVGKLILGIATNPLVALVAAVGLLAMAWKENWFGIRDKTRAVIEHLRPVIENVTAWFEEKLPIALAFLQGVWESTLRPAFEEMGNFISTVVVPALQTFAAWLEKNLPIAFAALEQVYHEIFEPILIALQGLLSGAIIPIIRDFVGELVEALPGAMATVKSFWEGTLRPALTELYGFIEESVVPAITTLIGWLEEKLPLAYEKVKQVWNETLRPAFEEVVAFIEDPVIVTIGKIISWLSEKIPEAFTALEAWWNETGQGIFQAVVDFIEDPLLATIGKIAEWLGTNVPEAFAALGVWWDATGKGIVQGIVEVLGKIVGVVEDIIGAVGRAIEALGKLGDWTRGEKKGGTHAGGIIIPGQQFGGFWRRGGLASLHPGEMVLPLSSTTGISALTTALTRALEQARPATTVSETVNIYSELAAAVYAERRRQQRLEILNMRM